MMNPGKFRHRSYYVAWQEKSGTIGTKYYNDIESTLNRMKEALLEHGNVRAVRRGFREKIGGAGTEAGRDKADE